MKTVLEQRGLIECWRDAQVFTTPYGGKYVYNIAGTTFCVHLKDADEVSFFNSGAVSSLFQNLSNFTLSLIDYQTV